MKSKPGPLGQDSLYLIKQIMPRPNKSINKIASTGPSFRATKVVVQPAMDFFCSLLFMSNIRRVHELIAHFDRKKLHHTKTPKIITAKIAVT